MEDDDDCSDRDGAKVFVCNLCYAVCENLQQLTTHKCSDLDNLPSLQSSLHHDHSYALCVATDDSSVGQALGFAETADDQADNVNNELSDNGCVVVEDDDDVSVKIEDCVEEDADAADDGDDNDFFDNLLRSATMYHCEPCSQVFHDRESFSRHKCNNRRRPRVHSCGMCGKSFNKASVLQVHLKIHYASKNFKCNICSKAFLHKHQLIDHEVTHSSQRPFECENCLATFKRLAHLSRHQLTHTGERSFACDRCDYKGISQYAIRRHQMSVHTAERPFSCPHCPCRFSENYKLNKHIDNIHKKKKVGKARHMVPCLYCDKKFFWRKHLSTHLQSDHADEFQKLNVGVETLGNSPNPEDPDYDPSSQADQQAENAALSRSKCWFCEKMFSREIGLIRHMKKSHECDYEKAIEIKKEKEYV